MLLALFVLVMLVSVTSFKRSLFPRRVLLSSVLSLSTAPVDPKVEAVRRHMRQSGIDAWIIPTNDPHMSEYTAPYYNRRAFISGFTGSAGTAVITHNASLLFTDGRYHAQAEMELKASWTLMKSGMPGVPTPVEYLAEALPAHSSVGFDPLVHNAEDTLKMHAVFDKKHLHLKACSEHPVDAVWGERPALPCGQLREHPLAYAGKSREEKMIDVRKAMAEQSADMLVIGALDEIMWLYNIRGVDVPCNPVSIAYAVLCTGTAPFPPSLPLTLIVLQILLTCLLTRSRCQRISLMPCRPLASACIPTLRCCLSWRTKPTAVKEKSGWILKQPIQLCSKSFQLIAGR